LANVEINVGSIKDLSFTEQIRERCAGFSV